MPKKVLVVDDDADVVRYFKTLLDDHGYETITALDGGEAIQRVRSEHPDLVTLDISMSAPSGVRVYREIKEHAETKDIPVLMVTGVPRAFRQFIHTRRQVPPPDGYLEKPVALGDVLSEVRRLIGPGAWNADYSVN
jgi:CheY-like chemotaxis protein